MTVKEAENKLKNYKNMKDILIQTQKEILEYKKLKDEIEELKEDGGDEFYIRTLKVMKTCYGKRIGALTDRLENVSAESEIIEKNISILDYDERKILDYRYFKGYSWVKIGRLLDYSEKHLFKLKRKIMNKLCGNWVDN